MYTLEKKNTFPLIYIMYANASSYNHISYTWYEESTSGTKELDVPCKNYVYTIQWRMLKHNIVLLVVF